jgi:uncharacterized protein with GYD domain
MIFVTLARLVPGKGREFVEALKSGGYGQSQMPPGVRIVSAYVTFGQYDLVLTIEARDLATANRALRELITPGLLSTETLVGQTVEEFIA